MTSVFAWRTDVSCFRFLVSLEISQNVFLDGPIGFGHGICQGNHLHMSGLSLIICKLLPRAVDVISHILAYQN